MIKVLAYKEESELQKRPELLAFLKDQVQLLEKQECTPKEILKLDFNILEMPLKSFQEFRPFLSSLSVGTYDSGLADCLIRKSRDHTLREIASLPMAIQQVVTDKNKKLDTSGRVLICGRTDFVIILTRQFHRMGFRKFLLSPIDIENRNFIDKLKKGHFDIEIEIFRIEELNQLSIMSDVMIISVSDMESSEFYESLSYFNYLSRNAIFLDLQDRLYPALRDEARRTELSVIDSLEVYKQRYKYLLDLLKNTP